MFSLRSSPQVVRSMQGQKANIYLTFDDGPSPETTPQVLDLLRQENVLASFFVIGRFAKQESKILKRILSEGHGVFSHSSDHDYRHYFQKEAALKIWLKSSLQELEQLTGEPQKIFRPPAGILTPPLLTAAVDLKIPLVLWNQRFFDTARRWTLAKADQGARQLLPGSITLLHDRQKPQRMTEFCHSLRHYIRSAKAREFKFSVLSQDEILTHVQT